MEKQHNKRLLSYKSSSKGKAGISDRRVLHAHNKSVEWKNSRSEEVNRRRKIPESMTPIEEHTDSKNIVKSKQDLRSEQLKKWKEQRELKQKLERLERERSNPMFKVKKVDYTQERYLTSKASPVSAQKKTVTAQSATSRRSTITSAASKHVNQPSSSASVKPVTRSSGLAGGPKPTRSRTTRGAAPAPKADLAMPQTKTKPVVSACATRVTRQRAAQSRVSDAPKKTVTQKGKNVNPVATKQTDSGNSAGLCDKKQSAKVAKTKEEPASDESQCSFTPSNKFVTSRLDSLSFAPEDFTFSAPANLTAFQTNPLSPNSAANFLYSGIEGASSYFVSPNLRRCSTPKQAIKGLGSSVVCSPADVAIEEESPERQLSTPSNTSDNDVNKSSRRKGRKSMCRTPPGTKNQSHTEHADSLRKSIRKSLGSLSTIKGRRSLRLCSSPKSPIGDNGNTSGPTISEDSRSVRLTHDGSVLVTSESTDANVNDVTSPEVTPFVQKTKSFRRSVILTPPNSIVVTVDVHTISPSEDTVKDVNVKDDGNSLKEKNDHEVITSNTTSVVTHQTEPPHATVSGQFTSLAADNVTTTPGLESVVASTTVDNVLTTPCLEQQVGIDFTTDSLDVKLPHKAQPVLVTNNEENSHDNVHTPVMPVSRSRRRTRRSMSLVEPFIQPRTDVVFWSAKQASSRKRKSLWMKERKTPTQARSPEDWVNILQNSPMIEMERRRSKVKSPNDTSFAPLPIDFDLEDDVNIGSTTRAPSMSLFNDFVRETNTDHHNNNNTSIDDAILESSLPVDAAHDNMENVPSVQPDHCDASKAPVVRSDDDDTVTVQEQSTDPALFTNEAGEHTVLYFRELLCSETLRLTALCQHWQAINEESDNFTEEVCGEIRTTVGQGHLLMNQRFKQFTGLVDDCEFKTGEKETTCADLQGFWDMIYFQVEDVNEKFAELDKRRANNWVAQNVQIKTVIKPKITKAQPAKSSKNKPIKAKSKFAAFRAQMKKQKEEDTEALLKGATPSPKPTKAFEGGFFKVATPIQQPKFHCEGGSPAKVRTSPKTDTNCAENGANNNELSADLTSNDTQRNVLSETSLPPNEEPLFKFTPKRRSYLPMVPSPLLQDITPIMRRRARRQSTPASRRILRSSALFHVLEDVDCKENINVHNIDNTEIPDSSFTSAQDDIKPSRTSDERFPVMMTTDTSLTELLSPSSAKRKRRSSIQSASVLTSVNEEESSVSVLAEKSLNFKTPEGPENYADHEKENTSDRRASKRQSTRRSISHEIVPSPSAVNSQHEDVANILAKYLMPTMNKQEKTSSTIKSALKKKMSPRKVSQRRSVHFGSPACAQSDLDDLVKLPCTPYNRNSIVKQERVSKGRSLGSPVTSEAETTTPVRRRSTRPSLQSPQINQLQTVQARKADNLISFSP